MLALSASSLRFGHACESPPTGDGPQKTDAAYPRQSASLSSSSRACGNSAGPAVAIRVLLLLGGVLSTRYPPRNTAALPSGPARLPGQPAPSPPSRPPALSSFTPRRSALQP